MSLLKHTVVSDECGAAVDGTHLGTVVFNPLCKAISNYSFPKGSR
jgi:hypothetical protein